MSRVFISTSSFGKFDTEPLNRLKTEGIEVKLNPFGRKLEVIEIMKFLKEADFLIAGVETLNREVLESSHNLKIISRCGVGMDNIDLKVAEERGIKIFNTVDSPTQAVAEFTVGLILSLIRGVAVTNNEIKNGVWKKHMGQLLSGKNVGIIGFGHIGQKVAELLGSFNVEIAYYDINTKESSLRCTSLPLPELLSWADIVTLHCGGNQDSSLLIGKQQLEMMKKGSWIINAARGNLLDENALYELLKSGHIQGAAIDTFQKEPYSGPLTELPNTILTPHIGSYAKEARIKMEMDAVQNLINGITAV